MTQLNAFHSPPIKIKLEAIHIGFHHFEIEYSLKYMEVFEYTLKVLRNNVRIAMKCKIQCGEN